MYGLDLINPGLVITGDTALLIWHRDTISKESAAWVPAWVQDLLYLTAVLNSCLNPVVYGYVYMKA